MSAIVTPVPDDVFTALRAFIRGVIGGSPAVEVVKGLGNRVAMPPAPCVVMTPLFQTRLETNIDTWDETNPAPSNLTAEAHIRFDIQVDMYGPLAGSWMAMFTTLFRDQYGCDALAPNCQPLYADDSRQVALITGEQQYIERWSVTAALQYNPVTTFPMEFADALVVGLIDVDERYAP